MWPTKNKTTQTNTQATHPDKATHQTTQTATHQQTTGDPSHHTNNTSTHRRKATHRTTQRPINTRRPSNKQGGPHQHTHTRPINPNMATHPTQEAATYVVIPTPPHHPTCTSQARWHRWGTTPHLNVATQVFVLTQKSGTRRGPDTGTNRRRQSGMVGYQPCNVLWHR